MAVNQVATLGVKVDPRGAVSGARRAKRAIQGIGKVASGVRKSIFSLQGALVGLGAGLAIKSAISYGSEIESLRIRLRFLTGSTEKATKAFDQMLAVSRTAPVSLKEIQRASPLLLTVADDIEELTSLLEMTGDIAEVSGLSFEKTAEQIQRSFSAGIASAELFREKAVTSMMGFESGVSKTGAETKKIFVDMFANGTTVMKGAMQEGAKTMKGQISMMKDGWDALLLAFSDAGAFEATKRAFKEIEKTLKSQDALDMAEAFGKAVGQFIDSTLGMKDAILKMIATVDSLLLKFGIMPKTLEGTMQAIQEINGANRLLNKQIDDLNQKFDDTGKLVHRWTAENFTDELLENVEIMDILLANMREFQKRLTIKIAKDGLEDTTKVVEDLTKTVNRAGQGFAFLSHNANISKHAVEIMGEKMGEIIVVTEEAKEKTREFAESMSNSIEDSIMRMTQGLMSFKDVVKSVFSFIAQEMVRQNIAQPLADAMSGIMTGSTDFGGKGNGGILGKIFGDMFRADGGSVAGGQPYIVGERGPELFTPGTSGMITPNNKMGGQTINVTYAPQINALDPATASGVISENAPTIVNVIRQAFNDNGQEVAI